MAQDKMVKGFVLSSLMVIITVFTSVIYLINQYDNYIKDDPSNIISAFEG
ncbi:MAG: hypothetical protein WCK67_09800 [bacterium]